MIFAFLLAALLGGDFVCDPAAEYLLDLGQNSVGVPALVECERLPPADVCEQYLEVLHSLQRDLEAIKYEVPPWEREAVNERLREVEDHIRFHAAVGFARWPDASSYYRRERLAEIVELIGVERWECRDWPALPWWQFERR